ncbi:MAG: hypothetical protein ACREP9_14765, partial [Candidatus Dormibacteraceae bacterium]
ARTHGASFTHEHGWALNIDLPNRGDVRFQPILPARGCFRAGVWPYARELPSHGRYGSWIRPDGVIHDPWGVIDLQIVDPTSMKRALVESLRDIQDDLERVQMGERLDNLASDAIAHLGTTVRRTISATDDVPDRRSNLYPLLTAEALRVRGRVLGRRRFEVAVWDLKLKLPLDMLWGTSKAGDDIAYRSPPKPYDSELYLGSNGMMATISPSYSVGELVRLPAPISGAELLLACVWVDSKMRLSVLGRREYYQWVLTRLTGSIRQLLGAPIT